MGTYLDNNFLYNIKKQNINTIFELGSRDLEDAIKLQTYYKCMVYAFECNPDCLSICNTRYNSLSSTQKESIQLVNKAVSIVDGPVSFFPFDLNKYDNMGASSLLKIDFSKRDTLDPDYNRENPQTQISVDGTRLDTFCRNNNISKIDMLCIDLQGYELNALKSLGNLLHTVKYIITEASLNSTYTNGAEFADLISYLYEFNFEHVYNTMSSYTNPININKTGFSEFDVLFVNTSI